MTSRRYLWTGGFFALVAAAGAAALPHAIQCCSRLGAEQQAWNNRIVWKTWIAKALLDWPAGFTLLVMTITAAVLCVVFVALLALLSRAAAHQRAKGAGRPTRWTLAATRAVVASLMTAVLYMLSFWAAGYVGYIGPYNLTWTLAIPILIALLEYPRPIGTLLGLPLAVSGYVCLAFLAIGLGIPID